MLIYQRLLSLFPDGGKVAYETSSDNKNDDKKSLTYTRQFRLQDYSSESEKK
jgi:hypothetical protein